MGKNKAVKRKREATKTEVETKTEAPPPAKRLAEDPLPSKVKLKRFKLVQQMLNFSFVDKMDKQATCSCICISWYQSPGQTLDGRYQKINASSQT